MYAFLRLLSCLLLLFETAYGKDTKTDPKAKVSSLPEITIGKKNAPILIIDYSSLTCNHCAEFYLKVVPQIKEKYISPGYVRLILRDCPTDQISLKAHQIAWSKGELKYLDFVELLYSTQEQWLLAKDPLAELKKIVADKGISEKQFDEAIQNQELLDKIIQARLEGQKKYKLTATPTLIINTKIYPEALTMAEVSKILDPLLKPLVEKKTDEEKDGEEEKEKEEDSPKDSPSPKKEKNVSKKSSSSKK